MAVHGEAFNLMQYESRDGQTKELIWNSRDGVTPFICWSRDGVEMAHVRWSEDIRAPNHVPNVGDRVFIDATIEDHVAWVAERLSPAEWEASGRRYLSAQYKTRGEAIRGIAEAEMRDHPGAPNLVEVTEEMREMFVRKAAGNFHRRLRFA